MFWATSIGAETYRLLLNLRRYFPVALGVAVSVWSWNRTGLRQKGLFPYAVVSLAWAVTHNVLSYIACNGTATNLNNSMDLAFSGYVFTAMVLLRTLLYRLMRGDHWLVRVLFALLHAVLLYLPLTEFLYFMIYRATISMTAAVAILQTHPGEVWEYLQENAGYGGMVALCVLLLFLFLASLQLNRLEPAPQGHNQATYGKPPKKQAACLVVIFLAVALYLPKSFYGTGLAHSFGEAKQYLDSAKEFTENHQRNFQAMQTTGGSIQASRFGKPSTIILVIGESAGRNFMSVYGYQKQNTTPWMKASVQSDPEHFLLFRHAYSTFGSTVQALEMALTEKNQYNDVEFSDALTLLDLAKKAGYKTYWFSNQSIQNSLDTPIQLVAKTADVHRWIDEDPANQGRVLYDGDLLPCFSLVNPVESNFIVFHVMGSHELTIHRYPPEFTRFSKKGVLDLVSNYEDSMAYDDWVVQQIYTTAKEHFNLQAMIYFSDHGANPYRKRVPDHVPFINLRVPLLVYLSPEYETLYPMITDTLQNHRNQYFTNDLMYELVGGILDVHSDHLDETGNLASNQYRFTRATLKTDLGRKWIREDLDETRIAK